MHPILNIAVKAARNGSKVILQSVDRVYAISINEKNRNDFVTEVDKKTEQEIIATIQKSHPEHSILGEEIGLIEGNPDYQWIIDPLDGTSNFIHGFPQYAISIAFKNKGRIEQAVILDPIRDELFTASRGEGAHVNNRRIRVSDCKHPSKALLGTGFPFKYPHHFNAYLNTFQNLFPQVSDIRRAGSAALDLAYVAAGRLDGHWELGLQEWDIAAGALLIKEAGGLISDFKGEENYLKNGNVIAGNPKIFKTILQVVQPILGHL
jgi:myo-inositol-1(or 4)-monophosphatase